MAQDGDGKSLLDRIRNALDNLVTLEIVTLVGPVTGTVEAGERIRPKAASVERSKLMYSKIDLLQGDVTTCIPEEFATGELAELRAFHLSREEQGHAIVRGNIAALRELATLAREMMREDES